MNNEWKRYLILNTTTAPVSVKCKVERMVSKLEPIDLNSIAYEEPPKFKSFEEFMQEAKVNE